MTTTATQPETVVDLERIFPAGGFAFRAETVGENPDTAIGDYIVCEHRQPRNGERAAVRIDDGAAQVWQFKGREKSLGGIVWLTLKRNDQQRIVREPQVIVLGTVVGVIRRV